MTEFTASFDNGQVKLNGMRIGELRSNVLRLWRRSKSHMLKQPRRAWAVDQTVLTGAEQRGAQLVEVIDSDNAMTYRAAIALFHIRGFTVDRGWGPQRALALEYWQTSDNNDDRTNPPAPIPVQLAFEF